ncbi:hypothetical protein [Enterobacter asburiae]|uniref:hypothetical protein n=1 Tax=Enterobacter asburiae TaxID=61645 RepID=UPI00063C3509|nr:hypothetical protein [Enterobacter asburiae]KLF89808.1 hypothetical protein YA44_12020 [Enterobacter asburiae]KLP42580.1 hypothetical protein ABF55_17025 [Enterobacter asburiae]
MFLDHEAFSKDPFGYSALAWHKWGVLAAMNGTYVDITSSPTAKDLKNPILWLSHAHALSEAAICMVNQSPDFETMPSGIRSICHSQFHAVALMLVGYSLEVCLKAMILINLGLDEFLAQEKKYFHHNLDKLAGFIPDINDKELAILKCLSHFVIWAGRYPDPGTKRVSDSTDIFLLSEKYEISAKDVFELSTKVMGYVKKIKSDG